MNFQTINPATGQGLQTYTHISWPEAEQEIHTSWKAFQEWRRSSVKQRSHLLEAWARSLKEMRQEMAMQMTLEMGKPLSQSKAEIDKCVFTCEYLATEGPKWIEKKKVESPYSQSFISYEPLGPILAIMPWNFPLWQTVRFAAPALLAGNTVLLKHSDQVRGTAELIEKSLLKVSEGYRLFKLLAIDHEVSAQVMSHPQVRGVTFTGSTEGGRKIASTAASALKKHVLELGGSDAYVVMADAEIDQAVKICVDARLVNNGQSCVAAKRFIVERPVMQKFKDLYVKAFEGIRAGDPLSDDCRLGPLAAKKFQEKIIEQVEALKKLGGKVLTGGTAPQGPGAYYPPTVVYFEKSSSEIGKIETFGPVALLIQAEDANEALHIANDSPFGLGASLFTTDFEKAEGWMQELEAGFVALNEQVKSDVRLPFGGVKDSGYGRELSFHGLHEFCNIKTHALGSH